MQTQANLRPNNVRVLDCIEYCLKRISPKNNVADGTTYYTDGMVVDRNRDPRKLIQDKAQDFRELGTLVRIKEMDEKLSGTGQVGSFITPQATIEIICIQELAREQDQARITTDQLQGWLRHDIKWALADWPDGTSAVLRASRQMATIKGAWGDVGTFGGMPSCWLLKYEGYIAGSVATFPRVMQSLRFTYLYQEKGAAGQPGII